MCCNEPVEFSVTESNRTVVRYCQLCLKLGSYRHKFKQDSCPLLAPVSSWAVQTQVHVGQLSVIGSCLKMGSYRHKFQSDSCSLLANLPQVGQLQTQVQVGHLSVIGSYVSSWAVTDTRSSRTVVRYWLLSQIGQLRHKFNQGSCPLLAPLSQVGQLQTQVQVGQLSVIGSCVSMSWLLKTLHFAY